MERGLATWIRVIREIYSVGDKETSLQMYRGKKDGEARKGNSLPASGVRRFGLPGRPEGSSAGHQYLRVHRILGVVEAEPEE
jgi:hypothetical protein